MVAPEAPHSHPAHTGHRWLDIVLGLSAMFVSVVSLVVAVEHGRTMERMADANTRMVDANSWPFVQFDSHNVDEKGNQDVRLVLTNDGIGPARIETFELWWSGKPMASAGALLRACCLTTPAETEEAKISSMSFGIAAPRILRAGQHEDFYDMLLGPGNKELFAKLNAERFKITTRVCYCSVFDQCWVQVYGVELFSEGSKEDDSSGQCEELPGSACSLSRRVNRSRATRRLSGFYESLAKGEPLVIAKAGKPLVKVVALDAPLAGQMRRLGFPEGQILVPDDFDQMGRAEIEQLFSGQR